MAQVSAQSVALYQDWKMNNTGSYLLFQLVNDEIAVIKTGKQQLSWQSFVDEEFARSMKNEPCYAVYHFNYQTKTGGKRTKTLLIRWIPSTASPKDKMQYAMWSKNMKLSLNGIQCSIQAGDIADLDWDVVLESAAKFERDEI